MNPSTETQLTAKRIFSYARWTTLLFIILMVLTIKTNEVQILTLILLLYLFLITDKAETMSTDLSWVKNYVALMDLYLSNLPSQVQAQSLELVTNLFTYINLIFP